VLPANSISAEWVADRVRSLTKREPEPENREPWNAVTEQMVAANHGSQFPVPGSRTPVPEIYKTLTERRLDFRLYTLPTTAGTITRLLNTESRYEASLNFWDVPGEVYDGDIPPNILREMTRARGLILLINPSSTFAPPGSKTPIPEIYKTLTERRLDFRLYTLPTTAGTITRLLNTESRYEASLNFWDVPGEVYDGDIPPNILREMTRARGLILLINPSYVPDEGRDRYYMRFFDRTLGRLKFALAEAAKRGERVPFDPRTNQLTIPVAVCLSQIDRSSRFMDAEPKALFEETVGDTAPILYSWLTTFDIFKLSALGRPLRRDGDREVLDGEPQPKFVHLPISWIVSKTSAEARR
jgi:hypothetical protein